MSFDPKQILQRIRLGKDKDTTPKQPETSQSPVCQGVEEFSTFNRGQTLQKEKMIESIIYGNRLSQRISESVVDTPRDWELKQKVVQLENAVGTLQQRLQEEQRRLNSVRRDKSHLQTQVIKLTVQNDQLKSDNLLILSEIKDHPNRRPNPKESDRSAGKVGRRKILLSALEQNLRFLGRTISGNPQLTGFVIKVRCPN